MKQFAIWLCTFLPLCGLLLALSGGQSAPPNLPERELRVPTKPVLSSEDLVTERGEAPMPGLVLTLEDILVRAVESDYVRFSLELGSLARDEQGPYFKDLLARYYDKPERGGEAELRYDLQSPRLDADTATLLDEGGERRLVLPEGVVVRDARGQPLVETESRVGGGAQPAARLASWAVAVTVGGGRQVVALAEALRRTDPPILGRIENDRLVLDVRTLVAGDPERIAGAFGALEAAQSDR